MTVGELIELLRPLDPSTLVCVNDQEIVPATDDIDAGPHEAPDGDEYQIVILFASTWPYSLEDVPLGMIGSPP